MHYLTKRILTFKTIIYCICLSVLLPIQAQVFQQNIISKHSVIIKENNKVGLKNRKNILIPAIFNQIEPFRKNYALVTDSQQKGIYELGNRLTMNCEYDSLINVNDSLVKTYKKGLWGLYKINGTLLLENNYKKIEINGYGNTILENFNEIQFKNKTNALKYLGDSISQKHDSIFVYNNSFKKFIGLDSTTHSQNKEQNTISSNYFPDFQASPKTEISDTLIKNYSSDFKVFNDSIIVFKQNSKWGFSNFSSTILSPTQFEEVEHLHKNYFKVKQDSLWGITNHKGQLVSTQFFDCIETVKGYHYFKTAINNKYGLVSYNGREIIPCEYDYFKVEISENIKVYTSKGKYLAIVDTTGLQLYDTTYNYQEISDFRKGYARVKKFNKYGFINHKGGLTIATQYVAIADTVSEERLGVFLRNKWAIVDSWEKMLAQPQYDSVGQYKDSVCIAKKGKKYVLVDYNGKELCKPKFDAIKKWNHKYFIVKNGYWYGILQKDGNEIVYSAYSKIHEIKNDYILVEKNEKFGLINTKNQLIEELIFDKIELSNSGKIYFTHKKIPINIVKF
ncbi:MAG: WG repeat-containing protein [Cytophagales bacterium]